MNAEETMSDKRFTQKEAADYLRLVHGMKVRAPELSILRKFGHGPTCERSGRQVQYTQHELDEWAAIQSEQDAA